MFCIDIAQGHKMFTKQLIVAGQKMFPHTQGRNDGGARGEQYPGAESLRGAPKSPNNVISTFFNTVNFIPKDLRFKYGGAKLASCPGRRLTALRLCSH